MPKEKITREELGKQMMETTIIKSNQIKYKKSKKPFE